MLFEAWNDSLRTICGHYQAIPRQGQRHVAGYFRRRSLRGLDVADFCCDIRHINRTLRDVRQDDMEYFYLLMQISGQARIEQGEERAILEPGQLYLLDSTRPVAISFGEEAAHCLSVHLPRGVFLHETPAPFRPGPCPAPASFLARRLWACAAALGPPGQETVRDDPASILSLARMAFQAGSPDGRESLRRQPPGLRYDYAVREMEAEIANPELDLAWLAARTGVSPRQLERDFQAHDHSFVGLLREKRLKLARELIDLALRRRAEPRITEIAFSAGFRDISNFNRAFRQRYGHTPSAYAASRRGQSAPC
jgi:AraC-like DNA-binding protein